MIDIPSIESILRAEVEMLRKELYCARSELAEVRATVFDYAAKFLRSADGQQSSDMSAAHFAEKAAQAREEGKP